MEKAVLLRSITSYTSHASIRSFYRSSHRLIPNFHRHYPLRRHISIALPSHIQFSPRFSHISPKAISTSPQFSTDAIGAHDEAGDKLGFEKVSEIKMEQETRDPLEALRSVPSLSLNDIPKSPIQIPIEVIDINGVKVLKHDLFTRGVLYVEIVFDMSSLKQELIPLVPLFCQSLLEMGTEDLLEDLIRINTRGLSIYPFTSSKHGSDAPVSHIIIRGKAVSEYTGYLFDLVSDVLQDVQFADQELFKQFVSQSKALMENRLRNSGHDIVAARMDAMLNSAGWIREQMGGVSYLEFLKDLEEKVEHDWSQISASLEEIRKTVLTKNNCLVNLTAGYNTLRRSEKYVAEFLDSLSNTSPVASSSSSSWNNKRIPSINEAIMIPTQVNYVGKAINLYETGYQLKGSAYVISKHISNTWLRDRVRVSGGAYNGFCDFNPHSGIFSFLSHRDPNLFKTLDIYDGTGDFLRQMEIDDDTLTKAIIGTIVDVDSYPSAFKGYSSLLQYLLGITEEERQIRHEEILSTRLGDFQDFANAIDAIKDKGVVVAVASPDDVDAANKERPNFFQMKKAL